MWPFRRRRGPRLESVAIGELTTDPADYSILTVGQSRLADSFTALDFTEEQSPRFVVSRAHPVIDPRMKAIADIELHVDGRVVGYLRPPALNEAIDLLSDRHAEALDIPIAIFSHTRRPRSSRARSAVGSEPPGALTCPTVNEPSSDRLGTTHDARTTI